jgi:Putative zinc-finger
VPAKRDRTASDRSIDRLIEGELRRADPGAIPPASPACVEAGLLAAWSERALTSEESREVEAHLADCARCQAMLAAFARAEPPTAAAPAHAWWSMRWLVPIAAAAAAIALAVWVARSPAVVPESPVDTLARSEPQAAPPIPLQADRVVANQGTQPPARPEEPQSFRRGAAPRQAAGAGQQTKGGTAAKTTAASGAVAQTAPPPAAPPVPPPAAAAPPPPPATPPPPPPAMTPPPRGVVGGIPRPPPAGNPVAAGAARAADETRSSTVAGLVVSEFGSDDSMTAASGIVGGFGGRGGGRGGGGGGGSRAGGGRGGGSIAPASPMRWRILSPGVVERSEDEGASWIPVPIEPAGPPVTGGVAPSRLVCWLVGREGLVLLTTDAEHFTRVAFPQAVDLASIRATNAREAAVTTTDGRTFTTSDGGQTWKPGTGPWAVGVRSGGPRPQRSTSRPQIKSRLTRPQLRESDELRRLSPRT